MKWRRFHNLFEASQTLFWAGFGMIGLDDFELTGAGGYTRFWSMLMFGAYSVINIIVLLNLLIAMMSNSYSFIVEHADAEWKFARTKLWMSYFDERCTLPPPFNIFPNVKFIKRLFTKENSKKLTRKLSARTLGQKCKARDYRYLSVMRALIWRYMCTMQKNSIERPVTEDDVNEVKGDISSLRFELIDLFRDNGYDTSNCENKSKAALGRKMRIWERRLMRDFHVSPAMGTEDPDELEKVKVPTDTSDQMFRIVKLAMLSKVSDLSCGSGSQNGNNQIGTRSKHDDEKKNTLKKAMEEARKKMQEGTPDNSPYSSRGCSPFPELYTGPHLLQTIASLDLSPNDSPQESPSQTLTKPQKAPHEKKQDSTKLMVPGKPHGTLLKKSPKKNEAVLQVPTTNVYSPTDDDDESGNANSGIEQQKQSSNALMSLLMKDKNPQPKFNIGTKTENEKQMPVPAVVKNEVSKLKSNFSDDIKDEKYPVSKRVQPTENDEKPSRVQQTIGSLNSGPKPLKPSAPKPNFSQAAVLKPTVQNVEKHSVQRFEANRQEEDRFSRRPSDPEPVMPLYSSVSELETMDFVRRPRRNSKPNTKDSS